MGGAASMRGLDLHSSLEPKLLSSGMMCSLLCHFCVRAGMDRSLGMVVVRHSLHHTHDALHSHAPLHMQVVLNFRRKKVTGL